MSKGFIVDPYTQRRNEVIDSIMFWKNRGYSLESVIDSLEKSLRDYRFSKAYEIVGREEFFKTLDDGTSRISLIKTLWDKVETPQLSLVDVKETKPTRKWWQIFKF